MLYIGFKIDNVCNNRILILILEMYIRIYTVENI